MHWQKSKWHLGWNFIILIHFSWAFAQPDQVNVTTREAQDSDLIFDLSKGNLPITFRLDQPINRQNSSEFIERINRREDVDRYLSDNCPLENSNDPRCCRIQLYTESTSGSNRIPEEVTGVTTLNWKVVYPNPLRTAPDQIEPHVQNQFRWSEEENACYLVRRETAEIRKSESGTRFSIKCQQSIKLSQNELSRLYTPPRVRQGSDSIRLGAGSPVGRTPQEMCRSRPSMPRDDRFYPDTFLTVAHLREGIKQIPFSSLNLPQIPIRRERQVEARPNRGTASDVPSKQK